MHKLQPGGASALKASPRVDRNVAFGVSGLIRQRMLAELLDLIHHFHCVNLNQNMVIVKR